MKIQLSRLSALLALLPMMIGTSASAVEGEDGQLSLRLCGGGQIIIPLADKNGDTPDAPAQPMTGGCHGVMRFGEIDDGSGEDEGEGAL